MISLVSKGIIICSVLMVVVFVGLDTQKIIVTPLTQYGMNHWIPEMVTIFFIDMWLVKHCRNTEVATIVMCLAFYPILTQVLIYGITGLTFGIGVGFLFAGILLTGIWIGVEMK